MIVKFCTYQFIEPNKFLNVGSRERFFFKKNEGSWERTFENLRVLRAELNSSQNKAENAKFSNKLNGGGGHMSDALMVNLGSADRPEKKRVMTAGTSPYHFPMLPPRYLLAST